jgi:hypothetical protein
MVTLPTSEADASVNSADPLTRRTPAPLPTSTAMLHLYGSRSDTATAPGPAGPPAIAGTIAAATAHGSDAVMSRAGFVPPVLRSGGSASRGAIALAYSPATSHGALLPAMLKTDTSMPNGSSPCPADSIG